VRDGLHPFRGPSLVSCVPHSSEPTRSRVRLHEAALDAVCDGSLPAGFFGLSVGKATQNSGTGLPFLRAGSQVPQIHKVNLTKSGELY
jgi:hypothetical protein